MPTLELDELTTPLTPDETKASVYGALATVGTDVSTWKPGAVARTIIAIVAVIFSAFSQLMALIAKSGWIELAEGDWLHLAGRYVFGVEFQDETFAAGTVTVSNAAGGVFDFDYGDAVFLNTATGKTYRNTNTTPIHIGAFQVGVEFPIEAIEAGADSTATPGAIDALETAINGLSVTNPTSVVGLDAESDAAYRLRCLEKRSTLSPNGPRDAYSYFAKAATRASDGSSVGVTRVRVSKSSDIGIVTVTVAGASGAISGSSADPATDLGAVAKNMQESVLPDGVTLETQSATPLVIPVTYAVWLYTTANLTSGQVQALVATGLTDFIAAQPIGGNVIGFDPGKVFVDAIRTKIGSLRTEIFHVEVTAPAADVVLTAAEVPELGTITCTGVTLVVAP